MIEFNIDPVLFHIGNLEIRYYGLVYFLGIILVYFYLKKKKVIEEEKLERLVLYLSVGMLIGARITGLISQGVNLLKEPLEFFRIWNGGMSFFGGFLGALIGGYVVLKKELLKISDFVVVPLSLVLIFGRLANFINQELIGKVTNVSWCFSVNQVCRHPYTLYAAFGHLILFLIVYFASRKNYRRGNVFFTFILGYGVLRLITDFFKERTEIFGLSIWQYLSIGFIVAGIYYLVRNRKNKGQTI